MQQKNATLLSPLPFDDGIFHIKHSDGQIFKRNWLSYNENNKKLFCSICLAFTDGASAFCQGFDRYRHLSQTVGEHEKSNTHIESIKTYIAYKQGRTIETMLFKTQLEERKKEIVERRKVVSGVIDVIKLIGKQGLAFRGKEESAYSLNDPFVNHGNFLEIFLLLSKYDENLARHVKRVTERSKYALEERTKKGGKGRGSQITFLSKTTVTKIISIIKFMIRDEIANDIRESKIFSVLMDTTMDVSSYDQCVIVLRYLLGKTVEERVIGLKCVHSTTGESLCNTFLDILNCAGLSVENCIANAFDGASNMSGEYSGVSSRLRDLVPNHVHTWCYAHVLNLVMSDTTQILPTTISFFGLLQHTQVFLKDSHKRLRVYLQQNPRVLLAAIGATRWRSRSDATTKIFGRHHYWFSSEELDETSQPETIYIELVKTLFVIGNSIEFNPKVRNEASGLLQKFLSFETILVAMMFCLIFKMTTPLSDYLQTKNLDYAQAWRLVSSAQNSLKDARHQFSQVVKAAERFVSFMSVRLHEIEEDSSLDTENLCLETELPRKRTRKIKKLSGEMAEDETALSEMDSFRIKVFNVVIDKIDQCMTNRFHDQRSLYVDVACFDPRRFCELKQGLPSNALDKICDLIPNIDKGKLTEELQTFVKDWPQISSTLKEEFAKDVVTDVEYEPSDIENNEVGMCSIQEPCNYCISCAYKVICDYNMYSVLYTELSKVYKYLLTIPMTQVSCERVFSKLKLIKTRVRSNLTNENLEAFVMMQCEKDKLIGLDNEKVIDKLCEQSDELKRLLAL